MNVAEQVLAHITGCVLDYAEKEHSIASLARCILEHAKQLFQCKDAILGGLVYDSKGEVVACPCYTQESEQPFQHDIFTMDSAFRKCIDSNTAIVVQNAGQLRLPARHVPIKNAALVPLHFKGRPSGLIALANRATDFTLAELEQYSAFFVVIANIIASFQLNEEMLLEKEKMVRLAESVAEAKDSFLAKISHEIRTPLNGIVGMTRVLLNMALNQNVRQKVNIINECSYQLISQVDDLLDYSKMTCGKLKLNPTPVCVRSCVEKAFDVIAAKASEKQLTINSIVDTAVPAYVEVDSKRLRQILVNLLNNAVKFTDTGYIIVRVKEILPRPDRDSHRLQFDVEDTGCGIPKAEHGLIFDIFTQGENNSMSEGAGLGLAICHKLVELMNGTISVTSEPGKGSCFSFEITVGSASVPKEDYSSFELSLQGMRALIVDDKLLNQVVLCNMLQKWGMSSVMCDNGITALKYLQSGMNFDIAFIDIQMPHMNGYELADRLRQQSGMYFPMIAVSSVDDWFSGSQSSQFTATLQKPLKQTAVYDAILRVLHPTQQQTRRNSIISAPSELPDLKILVVEDSESNQMVIESFLQQLGFGENVTMVENGLQAVKSQKENRYDIIFMDIKMPVMNGYDAAKRIRKRFPSPHPYIVALSAMVLDRDREQAKQCGMDYFLGKPIDMDELERVLRRILLHMQVQSSSGRDFPHQ